ncbi:GNAT family N-acetyltransferase [Actinoplanes sp. NPDC051513]|uniref:GNAT family N-acetyltransferase n=1 Tax=Actinoplanes sp. NPDC051513 TaxID=3363908 RepID=UPI003787DAB6
MREPLIDIVAAPEQPGGARWQAVALGGSVAGVAGLRPTIPLPALSDPGPDAAELTLYVEPEWRRRGIGSRLLAAVREHSAAPRLLADVTAGSPAEAFCRRHGFRHTLSRRHDLLTYCDVHQAWLGELVDAEHPGYRLIHWTGHLPGAPDIQDLLRSPSHPGNAVLTAADADGDLAAYAVAVVGRPAEPRARQYGPAVLPGHHGRRLGLWVNAALIQRLREIHPQITEIETAAAGDDPVLPAARRHLGFHPVRRTRLYELRERGRS